MVKKRELKRTAAFLLCAAAFAVFSGAAAQSARVENVREGEAVFSQWLRIEAGEGENQVGYRQDRISSGGPEDFLFTPEGELCIMDAVNRRIMFFEGARGFATLAWSSSTTPISSAIMTGASIFWTRIPTGSSR